MSYVRYPARRSKRAINPEPDLFSWRSTTDHGGHIASKIAQRYGISLPHAVTVARLAGFRGLEA